MSKVNRNEPKRSSASESRLALFEFLEMFPDDAACLEFLVGKLYPDGIYCPKCERVTKHHRIAAAPAYSCQFCGRHEHPMAGTIFQDSATSLKLWFYAMYLMASTRCGISAKQLERELGVTYKTAWRMFNKIRSLMVQDDAPLGGTVEVDEAFWGGKDSWKHADKKAPRNAPRGQSRVSTLSNKSPIVGMVQRGGPIKATVAPSVAGNTLTSLIEEKVLPKSMVYTDEWRGYSKLGKKGYTHTRVSHSQGVYVDGDVHTNTIEGFWSLLRRGISGAYHSVSTKWLQSYLDEFVFRYNNRDARGLGMFSALMDRVRKAPA